MPIHWCCAGNCKVLCALRAQQSEPRARDSEARANAREIRLQDAPAREAALLNALSMGGSTVGVR